MTEQENTKDFDKSPLSKVKVESICSLLKKSAALKRHRNINKLDDCRI